MVAALSAAVSLPASAQRLGPPAERPRLEVTADTNDAQAYYERGVAEFQRDRDADLWDREDAYRVEIAHDAIVGNASASFAQASKLLTREP